MFRFLPSIPVPYKNLLAPWVSIYSLSWYFVRLAFFATYSSLFICFKCAVSIVSTVPLKPNKIMGRCRERSMKSIFLEPNTLFSLALPFYKLGQMHFSTFLYTNTRKRYVRKLLSSIKIIEETGKYDRSRTTYWLDRDIL